MATVIVKIKVMPESPDQDLFSIKEKADEIIKEFGAELGKVEEQPVAFGLKALMLYVVMDEAKGSTENMENKIAEIPGVNSVDVVDVRRAIG